MKKLILLGACLLTFTACPAQTVAAAPDIVVVRVFEGPMNVRAVIIRGTAKPEVVNMDGGQSVKDLTTSGEAYHKLLTGLYQQGYTLQSTFGSPSNATTTLLFVKAK